MAPGLTALLPDARVLAAAVALDLALGDPRYPLHPVRLIGASLSALERGLRRLGADGYGGGIALFAMLALMWGGGLSALLIAADAFDHRAGLALHLFLLYSLLALGDLLRHGARVEGALVRGDLDLARRRVSELVGRDTDRMDAGACRRAVIESLSENLTDGFVSPVFWYALLGLPGLVLFKVVSTMDSMVGFKTPLYLRFGWCGARLDDVLNYPTARLTWLIITAAAALVPGCSPTAAFRLAPTQYRLLPSPNSGWPEIATAGAIQRRLAGPIWLQGRLVNEVWLGRPEDPTVETHEDYRRAVQVIVVSGLLAAALAAGTLLAIR